MSLKVTLLGLQRPSSKCPGERSNNARWSLSLLIERHCTIVTKDLHFCTEDSWGGDNFSNFSSGLANLQPRLRILSEDSLASIFHRRKHKGRM